MIVLISIAVGVLFGIFVARRNKGNKLDMAQFGAVFGIVFGLLGMIVTLVIEKMM